MPAPANPSRSAYNEYTALAEDSYGIFGQIDWQASSQFKITTGLRYSYDKKSGDQAFRMMAFNVEVSVRAPLGVNTFGANTPAFDTTACHELHGQTYRGTGACTINANGAAATHAGRSLGCRHGNRRRLLDAGHGHPRLREIQPRLQGRRLQLRYQRARSRNGEGDRGRVRSRLQGDLRTDLPGECGYVLLQLQKRPAAAWSARSDHQRYKHHHCQYSRRCTPTAPNWKPCGTRSPTSISS